MVSNLFLLDVIALSMTISEARCMQGVHGDHQEHQGYQGGGRLGTCAALIFCEVLD